MSRARRTVKNDSNQKEIVDGLLKIGAKAKSLAIVGDGCPDLVVGYRGVNVLLEIKDGEKVPSKQALTSAEKKFHAEWPGQVAVVTTVEEAQKAVIEEAARRGFA